MHQSELNPLEQTISEAIKQAVSDVQECVEYKRKSLQYDKSLANAELFLREYRDCKWKGTASELFRENVKEHVMYSHKKNAFKKLLTFVGLAALGMTIATVGYKMNMKEVGMIGDFVGVGSVIMTYLSFRFAGDKMEKIYNALTSDADSVNKVLRHIYTGEKCR